MGTTGGEKTLSQNNSAIQDATGPESWKMSTGGTVTASQTVAYAPRAISLVLIGCIGGAQQMKELWSGSRSVIFTSEYTM
jgi:hypothetical protein